MSRCHAATNDLKLPETQHKLANAAAYLDKFAEALACLCAALPHAAGEQRHTTLSSIVTYGRRREAAAAEDVLPSMPTRADRAKVC